MSKPAAKNHEPLFHVVKRPAIPLWQSLLIRAGSILAALIVAGLLTYFLTGLNPISVYSTMIDGAIGTEKRIWNLLQGIALLLCVSLAVTPAFKMKFWNIGAEGQALMGGLASALCMILLSDKLSPAMLMAAIEKGFLTEMHKSRFFRLNTYARLMTFPYLSNCRFQTQRTEL